MSPDTLETDKYVKKIYYQVNRYQLQWLCFRLWVVAVKLMVFITKQITLHFH